MKISLAWLQDYVTLLEKNPQVIADRITAGVAEVDDVVMQGAFLDNCCVGKIVKLSKHPNADKLSVCEIQTDRGMKHVVCGGTNLREGMRIAFAHVGATVKHGEETLTLTKAVIRGEESEGMICAAEELDLTSTYPPKPEEGSRPIIDLGDGTEGVGKDLRSYLGLNDAVLHIDNHAITHRADLFSHIGFAREFVALGLAKWKSGKEPNFAFPKFPKEKFPLKLVVEDKALVSRYGACMMTCDSLGETPEWMKQRLESVGWRSVSLPVDITNYVASEVGIPLHCFDADDLRGAVVLRESVAGENITTLDKAKRELPPGSILLSDDDGIFDLLGIMGGLRSSTKSSTRHFMLHAAVVDPVRIRKTVIATGHRTDASTVYEKGVPRVTCQQGLARAIELFLELVPGCHLTSSLESFGTDGKAVTITVSPQRINSLLGTTLTPRAMGEHLKHLGCKVTAGKTSMKVTPPLYRNDLKAEHDIAEEVGRLHGYNVIPDTMPIAEVLLPPRDHRLSVLRHALAEHGFTEFLPLSLLGPDLLKKSGMDPASATALQNALGEELSLLQPSPLPRLLEFAEQNLLNVEDELRGFHMGTVFRDGHDSHFAMGGIIASRRETPLLQDPVLELKTALLESLFSAGYRCTVVPDEQPLPCAHPGRAGVIHIQNTCCGRVFELHPELKDAFKLPGRAAVVLLNVTALFALPTATTLAAPLSQFPAVTYDVTFSVQHSNAVAALLEKARKASALLSGIAVADLYDGKGTAPGSYNLTVRCTYRAEDRTLTEDEAKKEHAAVLSALGV